MIKPLIKSIPFIKWLYWYICRYRFLSQNGKKSIYIHDMSFVTNSYLAGNNVLYPNVIVGNSSIGQFVYVDSDSKINHSKIGHFCSIGPSCRIGLFKHPPYYISTSPVFFSLYKQCAVTFADDFYYNEQEEVNIGNDVWIGANALIADGVSIGDGAIIAAGAVVTKDVEPYSIVGGVPAKCLKKRFSESQIEKLLKLKWWDKELDWINSNWKYFNSPDLFFEKFT